MNPVEENILFAFMFKTKHANGYSRRFLKSVTRYSDDDFDWRRNICWTDHQDCVKFKSEREGNQYRSANPEIPQEAVLVKLKITTELLDDNNL